ncbi:MAG: hypothetical protein FSLLV1_gp1 [Hangzhou scotinophara lurida lispivirus 1]|uniref:Uncharacterized protein n=1 Tax=Hangzhou scotinophara lurida lispivirus 1 TaxID=2905569 RepID=A0A8K1XVW4_9MONO|nr:MAG: hypothetical protein QKV01_gp1 [Hangzhou scotinophara lurida lispivirus 1]UHK03258.1 MAG: hypothetical protein FSLLV1_gp1 [Hangzhou scotinophara lurida lispivirus 1]
MSLYENISKSGYLNTTCIDLSKAPLNQLQGSLEERFTINRRRVQSDSESDFEDVEDIDPSAVKEISRRSSVNLLKKAKDLLKNNSVFKKINRSIISEEETEEQENSLEFDESDISERLTGNKVIESAHQALGFARFIKSQDSPFGIDNLEETGRQFQANPSLKDTYIKALLKIQEKDIEKSVDIRQEGLIGPDIEPVYEEIKELSSESDTSDMPGSNIGRNKKSRANSKFRPPQLKNLGGKNNKQKESEKDGNKEEEKLKMTQKDGLPEKRVDIDNKILSQEFPEQKLESQDTDQKSLDIVSEEKEASVRDEDDSVSGDDAEYEEDESKPSEEGASNEIKPPKSSKPHTQSVLNLFRSNKQSTSNLSTNKIKKLIANEIDQKLSPLYQEIETLKDLLSQMIIANKSTQGESHIGKSKQSIKRRKKEEELSEDNSEQGTEGDSEEEKMSSKKNKGRNKKNFMFTITKKSTKLETDEESNSSEDEESNKDKNVHNFFNQIRKNYKKQKVEEDSDEEPVSYSKVKRNEKKKKEEKTKKNVYRTITDYEELHSLGKDVLEKLFVNIFPAFDNGKMTYNQFLTALIKFNQYLSKEYKAVFELEEDDFNGFKKYFSKLLKSVG